MMFGKSQQKQFREQSLFSPPYPQRYDQGQRGIIPNPFQQNYDYPQPYMNQQFPMQKHKSGMSNKIMTYFKTDDGSLDYEKIGNGVMQVYGIAGKVAPMVKNLSPLLGLLKK